MAQAIEEELKKLSKLPENRRCANCEAENRFGWSNICIKFRVFVCGKCKSSFQAYSFRVKELGQSNFTEEEVASLRSRNGGGNDVARATYLARLPLDSPQRLREGDPEAKYKAFVLAVYDERRYWAPAASSSSSAGGAVPPPRPLATASAAPQSPAVNVAATKGRWGPTTPSAGSASPAAASSTNSLARQNSAFSVSSSATSSGVSTRGAGEAWMRDGADGITVRTEPPAPAPAAAEPEVDLLGVSFTASSPPAASPPIALASGLDHFYAGVPSPAPQAAAAQHTSAAFGGSLGTSGVFAPTPAVSGFGFFGGATPSAAPNLGSMAGSGGSSAHAISGLHAVGYGGGVVGGMMQPQQQSMAVQSFGFAGAAPTGHAPPPPATSGGLDAVMRGLADAEQAARQARTAPVTMPSTASQAPPAGGLEFMMAGFNISSGGLRSGAAVASPQAMQPAASRLTLASSQQPPLQSGVGGGGAPMLAPSASAMGISALLAPNAAPMAMPFHGAPTASFPGAAGSAGHPFGHHASHHHASHGHHGHHHHHHGGAHSAPPMGHAPAAMAGLGMGHAQPMVGAPGARAMQQQQQQQQPMPQTSWTPPPGSMATPQRTAFDPFFGI